MDQVQQTSREIAKNLVLADGGIFGPKTIGHWQAVGSEELIVPTLRALVDIDANVYIRSGIIRMTLSDQVSKELIEQISLADEEAMLRTSTHISVRQRREIVEPYLEFLEKHDQQTFELALGKLLFKGIYDYHCKGDNTLLDIGAKFDLNISWEQWEENPGVAGPVHIYVCAIHEQASIPVDRFEHSLDVILGLGADIDGIKSGKEPNDYQTPLEILCHINEEGRAYKNYATVIGLLLERGADWNKINPEKFPRSWQTIQSHPVVVKSALSEVSKRVRSTEMSQNLSKSESLMASKTPKL